VVLDGAIEKYPSGTTIHAVLADLIDRVTALENGTHRVFSFTAAALIWVQPHLLAEAIIFNRMTPPFPPTVDAVIVRGRTEQPITLSAWLIRPIAASFTASAYLIDHVY
jgi:hypothetical protein